MPKRIRYCENHPDVVATESCSECKKRVCYNCQIEAFGKTFCSGQCLTVYIAQGITRGIFGIGRAVFLALTWPFRAMSKITRHGWAAGFLVLILMTSGFFIWKLTQKVRYLENRLGTKQQFAAVIIV